MPYHTQMWVNIFDLIFFRGYGPSQNCSFFFVFFFLDKKISNGYNKSKDCKHWQFGCWHPFNSTGLGSRH